MPENYYPNDDPDTAAKKIANETKEKWFSVPANQGSAKGNGKDKDKNKKHASYFQKYTGPDYLAESVIIGNTPFFAISNATTGDISLKKSIPISDGGDPGEDGHGNEYKPFESSAYLNEPYRFESVADFNNYVERAVTETLDSLYRKVKAIWSKYIDADDFHISICAADTIFTYFQDKMGITHYLYFVGGNDSGKSNNLSVLRYLAYRNFTSTGLSVANVYQFLGSAEEGQGTLCYDESDKIDEDRPMMSVLKNGYTTGFAVPKIDTSFGRKQMKFNTYCFKAFAAEKFLDPSKAKGLIQRCIKLECSVGDPEYDISEVVDKTGDEEFTVLRNELNDMRNILLISRLLHFHHKIANVKLNIKRREKQLFKPIIRIFQNSSVLAELLPVISNYIIQKREVVGSSLHAFLYRQIKDIIKDQKKLMVPNSLIWGLIKANLQGQDIPGKPLSCDTSEFGIISQKEIFETLRDVFGTKHKKTNGVRHQLFDPSKLKRLSKIYDLATEIKVSQDEDEVPAPSGSDWTDWTDVGLVGYMKSASSERGPMEQKEGVERETGPTEPPIHLIHPSNAADPTLPNDSQDSANRQDKDETKDKEASLPGTRRRSSRRPTQYSSIPSPERNPDPTPYNGLIMKKSSQEFGIYYQCKEHPEDGWYPDLNGIIISHFRPTHDKNNGGNMSGIS